MASPTVRLGVLLAVLGGAAWLKLADRPADSAQAVVAAVTRPDGSPNKASSQRGAADSPVVAATPEGPTALGRRELLKENAPDLFAGPLAPKTEAPPPKPAASVGRPAPVQLAPPVVIAVPNPPPSATVAPPTFPYQVIGQYQLDEQRVVFLNGPTGTVAAATGQVLDGGWHVAGLDDTSMKVMHSPTKYLAVLDLPPPR